MYNVIKFKDNTYLATNKSVAYFNIEEEAKLVAKNIKSMSDAIELEKWFARPINNLFDKIAKAPVFYLEGEVAIASDDFNY